MNAIEQPGTDEADWRAWAGLHRLPVADLTGWARVLVLAAHPDDEVLGVGGTMALLAAAGTRLRLVSVTDGEASHPGHPDPAALATRRAAETASALRVLGAQASEVIRLGFPDTRVAAREDDLAARLRDLASDCDAVLAPWDQDVHADHEAVGRAARRASPLTVWYPVWTWHWARPGDPRVPWSTPSASRCGPRLPPANALPSAASPASWNPGVPAPAPSSPRTRWPISPVITRCCSGRQADEPGRRVLRPDVRGHA